MLVPIVLAVLDFMVVSIMMTVPFLLAVPALSAINADCCSSWPPVAVLPIVHR